MAQKPSNETVAGQLVEVLQGAVDKAGSGQDTKEKILPVLDMLMLRGLRDMCKAGNIKEFSKLNHKFMFFGNSVCDFAKQLVDYKDEEKTTALYDVHSGGISRHHNRKKFISFTFSKVGQKFLLVHIVYDVAGLKATQIKTVEVTKEDDNTITTKAVVNKIEEAITLIKGYES